MKEKKVKITFHSRFGLRFLQILIIVLAIILIQRCIAIYQETKPAEHQTVLEYYGKGFAAGREKANGANITAEPIFEKGARLVERYLSDGLKLEGGDYIAFTGAETTFPPM